MGNKPVSTRKIILIAAAFAVILTLFRAGWIWYHQEPVHPSANQGVIDLSEWDFSKDEAITLDGEWEFYPDAFLDPNTTSHPANNDSQYIDVPQDFNSFITQQDDVESYGYGTYRLTVLLPEDQEGMLGIRLNEALTAADGYVNGKQILKLGKARTNAANAEGTRGPIAGYFLPEDRTAELIIHVSNFGHPLEGGLTDSVQIGNEAIISEVDQSSRTLQLVVAIIFFLHCIYAVFFYFMSRNTEQKELLFFGLMLALHGFTILIDDDIVLQLPISYIAFGKLTLLLFISILITLVSFIRFFFKVKSQTFKYIIIAYVIVSFLTIIMPFSLFSIVMVCLGTLYLWTLVLSFSMTIQELKKGNSEAMFILLFLISYLSNIIWGFTILFNIIKFPYYPFDFLITVFVIALILFQRQIRLADENKAYTRKLEKEDKRKDEFLASTSHELRNPLHSIMNIAHSLSENDQLTDKQKGDLNLIMRVGEHMRYTLNDLLDSTKLKDNQITLNLEAVNLNQLLAGVIDMAKFASQRKTIQWNKLIDDSFPLVFADRNRLIQILFNLLSNAAKFTERGEITVTATVQSGMAIISIQDTGIGIKEEYMASLFKPYEQFHEEVTSYEGGTGLGLFICKQLVELHGGEISAESKEYKGAIFTFTIPLYDQIHGEAIEVPSKQASYSVYSEIAASKQAHIANGHLANLLLVDDDPVNLQVLKSLIEHTYNVDTATSGQEALKLLNETQYDLVIADVMMPKMSGYELTGAIRERYSIAELPVVLLTARGEKEDVYTGFLAGANDYLIKPVSVLELKARVQTLTQLKQAITEGMKLEAAWLQAQIQPHFLFNTLNTIASMGIVDSDRMITLLNEFGKYLEKSFATYNTDRFIPLEKELELIRSYLYIEKARFGEKIKIKWELDDNLEVLIPPLSIQPILENALRHGILKRPKGGIILFKTVDTPSEYIIEIIDDGVGMDGATIKLIKEKKLRKEAGGVGLGNIHHRLLKLYNKELIIHSTIGKGTTVRIEIPKKTEDEN